jgi:hypothetical protein
MPDTGSPWNIPYAAPADLVRDWPALSEDVAEAVADGLDAASNAGIGSNVVQTVKTDTFSTTSTSDTDVTGLTATITPSSASSKVLVLWHVDVGTDDQNTAVLFTLTDGSNNSLVVGASGTQVTFGATRLTGSALPGVLLENYAGSYLWSPSTASAVTAKIRARKSGGSTIFVNRTGGGNPQSVSSLTLIEVAA